MKKRLLYIGIILLTLGIVLYMGIRSGDFPASMRAMTSIPVRYIAISVACVFGAILMQALSCKSALKTLGFSMKGTDAYSNAILGEFYSFITPGASGGQPMQVYQMHRWKIPVGASTAALTIHFHCFQTTLLLTDIVLFIVNHSFIQRQIGAHLAFLYIGFGFTALQLIGSLLIAFYQPPIRALVRGGAKLMRRFHIGNPEKLEAAATGLADGYFVGIRCLVFDFRHMIKQFAFAAGRLIMLMSIMYFIFRGLGQHTAGYSKLFTMSCLQYTSAAYTPLPGASGAQEGIFGLYFAGLLPGSLLLSGLLCWRFITYYLVLIVGGIVTTIMGAGKHDKKI